MILLWKIAFNFSKIFINSNSKYWYFSFETIITVLTLNLIKYWKCYFCSLWNFYLHFSLVFLVHIFFWKCHHCVRLLIFINFWYILYSSLFVINTNYICLVNNQFFIIWNSKLPFSVISKRSEKTEMFFISLYYSTFSYENVILDEGFFYRFYIQVLLSQQKF